MESAYRPETWHDFYVALAGVGAALWGLFFVAISLHPVRVGEHSVLRNRARLTLLGLYFLLMSSLLCLVPQPSNGALGIELACTWLLWLGFLTTAQLQLLRRLEHISVGIWLRSSAAVLMGIFGVVAGLSLWGGAGGGLLWNLVSSQLGLALTLFNAWSVSFGAELEDLAASRRPAVPPPSSPAARLEQEHDHRFGATAQTSDADMS